MTQRRKRLLQILLALVVLAVLAESALFIMVHLSSVKAYPTGQADVIVVLGARVMPDGQLSTTLEHRTQTAFEAYQAGRAGALIVCGAQGGDEPTTEAQAMANYLLNKGVPDEKIFLEDQSTDTRENLVNAQAIMRENGFETALLVTSDYHLQRALWLAGDVGLDATGLPAPGPDYLINQVKARLRETLSWIYYFITR